MFARMNVRRFHISIMLALLAVVLAACGQEIDPAPTATRDDATPIGLTVGTLADRIGAAWTGIDRYYSETSTYTLASPDPAEASQQIVEEAILPDLRRQTVTQNGVVQSEIVASGGNIYGRGPNLPGISQPNRDPDIWITINGNVLGPNNSFSGVYQSLLLPIEPPYSALNDADRSRPAEELGIVNVSGRACQAYRIVDTTLTGERVEVELALEESGLVCSIETSSGNSLTSSVYIYDRPAEIEQPASPVPAPAENG